MPNGQTDDEARRALDALRALAGVRVAAGREEATLAAYRSYRESLARLRRVELPVEAEPAAAFSLERDPADAGPRGGR